MKSPSNILDHGMTESQARDELYRADMRRWFPGTHAHNSFAIMSTRDGHEVARCDRRQDRDTILAMARSHEAVVQALSRLTHMMHMPGLAEPGSAVVEALEALKLAGRT